LSMSQPSQVRHPDACRLSRAGAAAQRMGAGGGVWKRVYGVSKVNGRKRESVGEATEIQSALPQENQGAGGEGGVRRGKVRAGVAAACGGVGARQGSRPRGIKARWGVCRRGRAGVG